VGEYVKLRKSGAQNFQGLCPFHSEKTPSFSLFRVRHFGRCLCLRAEDREHNFS
jgi:DNA primase